MSGGVPIAGYRDLGGATDMVNAAGDLWSGLGLFSLGLAVWILFMTLMRRRAPGPMAVPAPDLRLPRAFAESPALMPAGFQPAKASLPDSPPAPPVERPVPRSRSEMTQSFA